MPPESHSPSLLNSQRFFDSIGSARHETFLTSPRTKVTDPNLFAEMKRYLANLYEGSQVPHSFCDDAGQVFDCVPIERQPSAKAFGSTIARPSGLPSSGRSVSAQRRASTIKPQLGPNRKDRFGNALLCPPGTIPMRRVTLEQLTRYESLQHFFRKTRLGKGRHPRLSKPQADASVHKYAYAYQTVNKLGGHHISNVWDPALATGQTMSLSQAWYSGGSGDQLQTLEVGWQVLPEMYNTTQPVLFIYWTADDYQNTGAYNLTKPGFVQTNPNWALGGALPFSASDGAQTEIELTWYLNQGNWWLYINGSNDTDAIGYYPTSIYKGGPLASFVTEIMYGGETVGTPSWPPMGSGAFAAAGFDKAAYDRDIYYFATDGSIQDSSLTLVQNSPACYTIEVEPSSGSLAGYVFLGGPGGTSC